MNGAEETRSDALALLPIIKVASTCNLACSYCSAEHYMTHGSESRMSESTMRRTVEELGRIQPRGTFLWHGGEPLLAGRQFYERALELQQELGLGDRFRNTMQSNGLLLDDSWLEFFARSNFSLGISIDGPKSVHDNARRFRSGKGSHERTTAAIQRAQGAGLHPGVLVVVTQESVRYPSEIFTFLTDSGFKHMDFKPCYGSAEHDVGLLDYAKFMIEIFDLWIASEDSEIRVRLLEGFIQNMMGSSARACSQTGRCTDLITVDHDGSVYPCDRFLTTEYRFGNINDEPLDVLYHESSAAVSFREHVAAQRTSCEVCSYRPVCRGGCTQERDYWPDEYCESRARIIDHIRDLLETHDLVALASAGQTL